jgi:hypothetical protein
VCPSPCVCRRPELRCGERDHGLACRMLDLLPGLPGMRSLGCLRRLCPDVGKQAVHQTLRDRLACPHQARPSGCMFGVLSYLLRWPTVSRMTAVKTGQRTDGHKLTRSTGSLRVSAQQPDQRVRATVPGARLTSSGSCLLPQMGDATTPFAENARCAQHHLSPHGATNL